MQQSSVKTMQLGGSHRRKVPLKSERKLSGTEAVEITTEQTSILRNLNISKNFFHIVSTLKEELEQDNSNI